MSREQQNSSNKIYYTVFDQKFRTRVREGEPDALERINKKGVQVFEREVNAMFGMIEDISVEDSDYGKQIKITLDANEDGKHPILGFGVESKNGRDMMKLLPAVDFSREVRILPYRFTPTDGKDELSGISIAQKNDEGKFTEKIQNYFIEPVTKKHINGYPTIDWDNSSESEQKIYKIKRDEFLLKHLMEKVIAKFSQAKPAKDDFGDPIQYPEDEINPADVPF